MANDTREDVLKSLPGPLDENRMNDGIRIWSEDDSRSILRLAPEAVQRAMLLMPEKYRNLTESEARANITVKPLDNQLRLSFWLEYERVQAALLPRMMTGNIIRGVCSEEFFYKTLLRDYSRLAWILLPPVHYTAKLMEGLDFGLDRIRNDILALPIIGPSGKVDTKVADLILKATMFLDMRRHGAFTQKIEQKSQSLSVSMHAAQKDVANALAGFSDAQLEKRLFELEQRENRAAGGYLTPTQVADIKFEEGRGQLSKEEWDAIKVVRQEEPVVGSDG